MYSVMKGLIGQCPPPHNFWARTEYATSLLKFFYDFCIIFLLYEVHSRRELGVRLYEVVSYFLAFLAVLLLSYYA